MTGEVMGLRSVISKFLPHTTKVCTCPPGVLMEGGGPPILVRSLMRSGTHVLIDLILNNFPELQRKPLYLDLDRYLESELSDTELARCGTTVIKGHYPQGWESEAANEVVSPLAQRSIVIEPVRRLDEVKASLEKFWPEKAGAELERGLRRYADFWEGIETYKIKYERLIDPGELEAVLEELDQIIPYQRSKRIYGVRSKGATKRVLLDKFFTRLLGRLALRINTTIHFAK